MPLPVYGSSPTTEPKVSTGGTGGGLPVYKAGGTSVPPAVGSKPSPAVEKAIGSIPTPTVENPPVLAPPVLPKEEKTGFAKYYDSWKGLTASFANDFATTLTDTVVGLPRNLAIYGTKAVQSIENAYANRKSLADPDYFTAEKVKKSARDPFYQDVVDELGRGKFDDKNWDTKIQDKVKEVYRNIEIEQGVDPENRTFAQNLAGGAGSVGAFFVPSTAIAKTMSGVAKTEKAAKIYSATGNVALTLSEAMMEGDQVFRTEYAKTGNVQDAQRKADLTVAANIAVLGVTNKFSKYFEGTAPGVLNLLKTTIVSGASEGTQEGLQQIISNVNTGRPIFEGVKDSALIGSILGSGTHVATRPMTQGQIDTAQFEAFRDKIIEENKNNPIVKDFVKYDSVREEVFKYIESTRKVESRAEIITKLEEAGIPMEIAADMVSKTDLAPVSQETVEEELARFKATHPVKITSALPPYVPKAKIKDEEKVIEENLPEDTITVNDTVYQLSGEALKRYQEEKARSDAYTKNLPNNERGNATRKGEGMKLSALKRELTGNYTSTELANKVKQEESNYQGKTVSLEINGEKVTGVVASAPAFGNIKVKLENGDTISTKTYNLSDPRSKAEIIQKITGREDAVVYNPKISRVTVKEDKAPVKKVKTPKDAEEVATQYKTAEEFIDSKKSPTGRIKTSELENVFALIPDGTKDSTGRVVKKKGKLFPVNKEAAEMMKNSSIDLDTDGSIKLGMMYSQTNFTEDVADKVLADVYNKSKQVEKKPKVESKPKEELVDIEKKKSTKVEEKKETEKQGVSRLNERLEGKLEKEMQGDVMYDKITFPEETAKALAFYEKDPQKAIDVATGKIEPPKDILYQAISLVVREKELEKKNFGTYKEVLVKASQRGSRTGQEISYLQTAFDETSPDSFIRQVLQLRRQLAEANYKPMFDKIKKRFGAGSEESVVEERLAKARKKSGKNLKQVLEFKAQSIDTFLEEMKC